MKIEIDTVKGFRDYLSPESLKRKAVKKVIERNFELYGFIPIETPIIEYDEIMKPNILPSEEEDEAVSERFRLKDRAGRNLGLRYEFTFQLSRIFKQNPNIKLPFRRYQIGEVFRDEPVSAGRFRQFTQCDADIVGDSSINAEAECLSLISDILGELKVNAEIYVNNRKLISNIIESVQITDIKNVMKELDKIEKIGEDNVKANLLKYADKNQILTLFKLLEKDLSFFKENAFEGSKEIEELAKKCRSRRVKVKFSPFMIRGLGYYTGNIFEVKQLGKLTLASGGRYDKSVGKFLGTDIPAVGISFGLDRLSEIANIELESASKVIIISINEDEKALKLTERLRKSGISSILSDDKVGKSLEYANSYNIPYVVFLGEDEVRKEKIKLRDMKSGKEEMLTEKQILKKLA